MEKQTLTGIHTRWPDFVMTLNKGLNLRQENGRDKWDCDGDLSKSKKILESMESIDIPATIEFLRSKGGGCDCEVMINVDPEYHDYWEAQYAKDEAKDEEISTEQANRPLLNCSESAS